MNTEKMNKDENLEGVAVEMPVPAVETTQADPFAKGRERMESVGNFFTKMKERAGNAARNVGGSISRFWNKTKSFGGEVVAGALSADDLMIKGVEHVGKKAEQAGEWVGDRVDEVRDVSGALYEMGSDYAGYKAEQLKKFAEDKVETAKDIAFYAQYKTVEGLSKAKKGVVNRYNKIKGFGESAIIAGKEKVAAVKEAFRNKMNEIRKQRLEAQLAEISQQADFASGHAENLRRKQAKIMESLGLLKDLNPEAQTA